MKMLFRDYSLCGAVCFLLAEDITEYMQVIDVSKDIKVSGSVFLN